MGKRSVAKVLSIISFIVILTLVLVYFFMKVELKVECRFNNSINITGSHQFKNGSHKFENEIFHQKFTKQFDYIIVNGTKSRVDLHLRGCICAFKPCIRVCEPFNSIEIYNKLNESEVVDVSNTHYHVLVGKPCRESFPIEDGNDFWQFLADGSIMISLNSIEPSHRYCLNPGYVVEICNDDDDAEVDEEKEVVDEPIINQDLRSNITSIGMLISIPFLLITFFVNAVVPELRNLHGRSLMCYVASLMFLYVLLILSQNSQQYMTGGSVSCRLLASFSYFFSMSFFFWLNVMCYDIYSTFRESLRYRKIQDKNRFTLYCLYAFGSATFLTIALYIMDSTSLISEQLRPQMGTEICWFKKIKTNEFFYFYYPILLIFCTNISLYSITAYHLYKFQIETSSLRTGDSQTHSKINAEKERFYLYLRLFILSGGTWSMEFVSWAFGNNSFFMIFDLLNCIQGFLIFIMFVCKPKVKKLLMKRYESFELSLSSKKTALGDSRKTSVETTCEDLS